MKIWFAADTAEETNDRDHDGVIDVIDDLIDLIDGYRSSDGFHARGLKQFGYSIYRDYARHPSRGADVALFLLHGGEHNQASWKQMLPAGVGLRPA